MGVIVVDLLALRIEGGLLGGGDRFVGIGGVGDVAQADVGLGEGEVGLVLGGRRGDPHPDFALR